MEIDDDLLNDFLEESYDLLDRIDEVLTRFSESGVDADGLDSVFRDVHTIKGASSMFEMEETRVVAHRLESFLGDCKSDFSKFDLKYVRSEVDVLDSLLRGGSVQEVDTPCDGGKKNDVEVNDPVIDSQFFEQDMEIFKEVIVEMAQNGSRIFEASTTTEAADEFIERTDVLGVKKLLESNLGTNKKALMIFVEKSDWEKTETLIDEFAKFSNFQELLNEKVSSECGAASAVVDSPGPVVEKSAADNQPSTKEDKKEKPDSPSEVLRIPLSKVSKTLNHVWEIFLIRNQIAYLFEKNKKRLKNHIDIIQEWEILDNALKRNVTEVEATAMSMRMGALTSLYSRMSKVIRMYQSESHKEIQFETTGENIELDKKVIDMLGEPFIHLIRNAMDHGIEAPEERVKLGKPRQGKIEIKSTSLSDKVIIKISDDGAGIDPQRLIDKAKMNGLPTDHLTTEKEILNLIFAPGFSTAESVSAVSGRGVGMDAVRQSIQKLGGEVSLLTVLGQGSTFTIELPLSMSVISAILYRVSGSTYATGINKIVEVCRVPEAELQSNSGQSLFCFRGDFITLIDLRSKFHCQTEQAEQSGSSDLASILVYEHNNELFACRVSEVLKHIDIVVKEVCRYSPVIDEVKGVSILATGEPIFILSMSEIIEKHSCKKKVELRDAVA